MSEAGRIENLSNWYQDGQLDIDKRLIEFRFRTLRPHFRGPEALELGPADGQMTKFLVKEFDRLTVVEGSKHLLSQIPDFPNLTKVHSLFEVFNPQVRFNTIIMEHILEHVQFPVSLLRKVQEWLLPGGNILVGVPNANSIHRLAAVKMGLLRDSTALNQRDLALGHRRVYTEESLQNDLHDAELEVIEMGGVFLKPLSNRQIQDHWTDDMIEGFYELGRDFPQNAAEIYAVVRPE